MKKRILILVNTGTPDYPDVKHVRRYLSEFLGDERVIDLPWLWRKILVNMIIVPFRAPKSAGLYKRIWTPEGSPLRINMEKLVRRVQQKVDKDTLVIGAMRYGNPSLARVLRGIPAHNAEKVVIFPLYPHSASSTTGSVAALVAKETRSWKAITDIKVVPQYYSNTLFTEAITSQILRYEPDKFDHILFSYHGLPLSHIKSIHPAIEPEKCNCDECMPAHGSECYRATCYETTRLLAARLQLASGRFSTSFQSRISDKWLTPFSDATLKNLALSGKKSVLVVAPSFAADCLETIEEIGHEYEKIFISSGGSKFQLVSSLNDNEYWAGAVAAMSCE